MKINIAELLDEREIEELTDRALFEAGYPDCDCHRLCGYCEACEGLKLAIGWFKGQVQIYQNKLKAHKLTAKR